MEQEVKVGVKIMNNIMSVLSQLPYGQVAELITTVQQDVSSRNPKQADNEKSAA